MIGQASSNDEAWRPWAMGRMGKLGSPVGMDEAERTSRSVFEFIVYSLLVLKPIAGMNINRWP